MADAPQKPPVPGGAPKGPKHDLHERVIIRPMPKAVMLYPTAVVCAVFGIIAALFPAGPWMGLTFMVVFAANLFIMNFEFGRSSAIALFGVVLALVFLGLFLGEKYEVPVFHHIVGLLRGFDIKANAGFYLAMAVILGATFALVWFNSRFDYWEITRNELLHHHGMWGSIERFPAPNLRITKEIDDLFEFLLTGAGRLVLYPASERRAIVLDTVFRVNQKEDRIKNLLSRISVDVEPDHPEHE